MDPERSIIGYCFFPVLALDPIHKYARLAGKTSQSASNPPLVERPGDMYIKSLYPPLPPTPEDDCNFHNLLFNSPFNLVPGERPDYTLHIDAASGRKRTRKEFDQRIRAAATALGTPVSEGGLGLNAQAGDIVGIFSPNCMEYIVLIHSLLIITTPFAPISCFSTPYELEYALRTAKITRLFVHPSLLSNARKAAREVGIPEDQIYIIEGDARGKKSLANYIDSVKSRRIPIVPVRAAKKNTLAYFVFSSGTSGSPKAVMISHGNLWFTMMEFIWILQEEMKMLSGPPPLGTSVWLAALPFHHSYGLHMFCFRGFLAPTTFVIMPRWDVPQALAAVPKYKVNMLPFVPSTLHQLLNSKELPKADLSSVDHILCGAAYLPTELAEKMKKFVKDVPHVNEGYGLSEATLSVCLKPSPGVLGKQPVPGSCGLLLPGLEGRLLREDGSEADLDEPGELWLRGENVALGYFNNEQATKETFVDGWLRTGDRVRIDANGTLYFVDRVKDTLKVGGVQVSPTEIEDVLRAHPDKLIVDVSVAGVSGGRTTDEKVPRAWVVLSEEAKKKGPEATIKALYEWSRTNLSSYKRLRGGIEIIDVIPKLPTGKVLRRELQARYEQQLKAKAKL